MQTENTHSARDNTGATPSSKSHSEANAANEISKISQEFHDFLLDIEDLFNANTSMTSDDLIRMKEKLTTRIDHAKKNFSEATNNATHRAKETTTTINNYVQENPWHAICAGATLGLLAGLLLARRK
jgi:ElaB/YqjD/DUF883 family membrane-anchored ribosome-binding protein